MAQLWSVVLGGLLAAAAGWGAPMIAGRSSRTQWLRETRQNAYLAFYNAWEDCYALLKNSASAPDIDASFDAMFLTARAIDLYSGGKVRDHTWAAVEALRKFRAGSVTQDEVWTEINLCLNAFKRDLGIPRSIVR